jgi:hypothetical protein
VDICISPEISRSGPKGIGELFVFLQTFNRSGNAEVVILALNGMAA